MKIKFDKDDIIRCRKFAECQLETSKNMYRRRNQANQGVIIKQIMDGKLSEIAVHKFMQDKFAYYGCGLTEPNFEIVPPRRKSYEADIYFGKFPLHIKTQSTQSANKYGKSWVFSIGDPLINCPSSTDIIVLTTIDTDNQVVNIYGFLPAMIAKDKALFKAPKIQQLTASKKVLYNENIKQYIHQRIPKTPLLNERFFERINSEESAYILGLLYADGSINDNRHTIRIELQARDIDILEKICKSMSLYRKPRLIKSKHPRRQDTVRLDCYSKKVKEDLINLGCNIRKTFTICLPIEHVSKKYMPHFIRGYFDGDGSIYISNRNKRQFQVSICSNINFIHDLQCFIESELGITGYIKPLNNSAVWSIGGVNDITKFLGYIYKNGSIFLNRKYQSYQKLLESIQEYESIKHNRKQDFNYHRWSCTKRARNNIDEIRQKHIDGESYVQLGKQYGVSDTTIRRLLLTDEL